ncbi:hypothetical protein [Flavobacterium sp.]|uniref:hypothetical protein n=1 Tax=Flavobacterium sp. TaxID=239 RepID=UPI003C41E6B4
MAKENNNKDLIDSKIKELKLNIDEETKYKFVNLLIDIIVSITLKKLDEKSD